MAMMESRRQRRNVCSWPYALLMAMNVLVVNGFVPKTPSSILYPRIPSNTPPCYENSRLYRQNKPSVDLLTRARKGFQLGETSGASDSPSKPKKRLKWKRVLIPKSTSENPPSHLHDTMTRSDQVAVGISTALGAAIFAWLIVASGPGAWRYYLAGGICAAASHSIPVPIDVVKTRKQVDPKLYKLNFVDATRDIVKAEGVKTLWTGMGPTFWGYMLEGSIKFGVYEILKPAVKTAMASLAAATRMGFLDSQLFGFAVCATISGFAASVVLCPMEALRIRLVSEPDFAPNGWIQGLTKILKNEGFEGLWKGLKPMMYKQVPYTVTKNVSFDVITRYAYMAAVTRGFRMTTATKLTIPFLSAVAASILSCISSQPGDMLLSLVNAHEGDRRRTRDVVRDILRSDRGVRGFFVGIKTRFLHVGVIVTLQLLIYDYVKRLCGIAATGTV